MQATANAELNSLQHASSIGTICSTTIPEYREYLSQSLSAFARKSEKNCRRSEQVGMRILEDRSAPQGKNI